ncbi:patatin-like phospholipase family protein [Pseudomonas matsuisoli]|uniref:Phospholipase n=1 Tax=Pseudomonas matsuisoli TaxID=1515666 RepID=A0A917PZZ7_9PSED|nr:patatin-like phospholipase family protein [Pseudomonas matsuisoli]GGK02544.1 phospholipase [Pseudomonas matsuisoli]
MLQSTKLGLVLSGGGAKGAYQAGVLRYLAEKNIQPDAVAGASIGSLNGAVVASAGNVRVAAETLEQVWHEVAENSPLKMDALAFLSFIMRISMAAFGGPPGRVAAASTQYLQYVLPEKYHKYVGDPAFFDNSPSVDILNRYAGLREKKSGLPFWVSVYESDGAIKDLMGFAKSSLGLSDSKDSSFICINPLSEDQRRMVLLASSAIPLAYEAQTIGGKKYYDGGLGGSRAVQGNTPILPLIKHEKCSHIIVTHLQDGSFWDRNRFPDTTILEIRPRGIGRKGLLDMLSFERDIILEWMQQGYEDAKASIEPVAEGLAAFSNSRESQNNLDEAAKQMAEALQWLKR